MSESNLTINLDYTKTAARNKKKKKGARFRKKMQHLKQKDKHMDMEGKHKHDTHRKKRCSSYDHTSQHHNGAFPVHPSPSISTHNKRTLPDSTEGSSLYTSTTSTSKPTPPASNVTGSNGPSCWPSVESFHKPTALQSPTCIPSKYLAIDCEMVGTGPKGSVSQLGRCSMVSYGGDVVYDKFIKPPLPVTDYRTRWSGIRPRDLANGTPYSVARKEILKLLTGKVVIGHAIHNDFKVLSYSHPAALTRDTSRIPLLNVKAGLAVTECASLKRLTKAIFNRDIQTGKKGHSSVEDARATMELYKVVEVEWESQLASKSSASLCQK